jgi:hypothetical protein
MTTTQENQSLSDDLMEMNRNMLSIAGVDGDTRIMWDPRIPDEVKVAKEAFQKAQKKGMLAYAVDETTGEKTGTVIREFDPEASKIIMTKQLQGG